jgi:ubiquinone/menaquinone biosynthesis C-methylase UbiE
MAEPDKALAALHTYDAFATAYDDFTHAYMNERWTGRLLGKAEQAGLEGNRLLDVACGTGKSFMPMLERGWEVTACDISPAMVEIAREKAGDRAALSVADMRELPRLGEFDLVWAIDDAINYLLSEEELRAALAGMARNLDPAGVLLFDVNTLLVYRTFFSTETVVERSGRRLTWRGQMEGEAVQPGSISSAVVEADDGSMAAHTHSQRHFTEAELLAGIEAAGLACLEVAGELEGDLSDSLDESVHTKAVYVCSNRAARSGGAASGRSRPGR